MCSNNQNRFDTEDDQLCILDSMDDLHSGRALVDILKKSKFLAIKNGDIKTISEACECFQYRGIGMVGLEEFGYEAKIYMGVVKIPDIEPYLFIGPAKENRWSVAESVLQKYLLSKLEERSGIGHTSADPNEDNCFEVFRNMFEGWTTSIGDDSAPIGRIYNIFNVGSGSLNMNQASKTIAMTAMEAMEKVCDNNDLLYTVEDLKIQMNTCECMFRIIKKWNKRMQ